MFQKNKRKQKKYKQYLFLFVVAAQPFYERVCDKLLAFFQLIYHVCIVARFPFAAACCTHHNALVLPFSNLSRTNQSWINLPKKIQLKLGDSYPIHVMAPALLRIFDFNDYS